MCQGVSGGGGWQYSVTCPHRPVHCHMGSLEKVLLPGEEVTFRGRLSMLPLIVDGTILLGGLVMIVGGLTLMAMPAAGFGLIGLGGVVLLIGCGRMARTLVNRGTTDMLITNRRVLSRIGVLRKESDEMFLGKIESVEVQQNLWARLMNYGTVEVNGSGEGQLIFPNIESPGNFRRACMAAVEQSIRGGGGAGPAAAAVAPVFEVQVLDGPGAAPRWVEVRAETAERAVALAAATGVKTGEARLKRIG